jgi:hypothetical protein
MPKLMEHISPLVPKASFIGKICTSTLFRHSLDFIPAPAYQDLQDPVQHTSRYLDNRPYPEGVEKDAMLLIRLVTGQLVK